MPKHIDNAKNWVKQLQPIKIEGNEITLNSDNFGWLGNNLCAKVYLNGEDINYKVLLQIVGYEDNNKNFQEIGAVIIPKNQQQDLPEEGDKKVLKADRKEMYDYVITSWKNAAQQYIEQKKREADFLREMINFRGGLDEKPKNKLDIQNDVDRYEKNSKMARQVGCGQT
jgi:electron transfer flavoprotein alpha subunit